MFHNSFSFLFCPFFIFQVMGTITSIEYDFTLRFSPSFAQILGKANRILQTEMYPEQSYKFHIKPDYWKQLPPTIGLLYCDIVEPSPVASVLTPILHILPLHTSGGDYLYEPSHLVYRKVVSRNFSDISFKITQPDGTPYLLTSEESMDRIKASGGITISLVFRPCSSSKYDTW